MHQKCAPKKRMEKKLSQLGMLWETYIAVEKIVRKGEIACGKQFFLFSQCILPCMALIFHFKYTLTHSLIHHFETKPNSKKLQTTAEMWLFKDFKIKIALKTLWKKLKLLILSDFTFSYNDFPKLFLQCIKMSIYGGKG